MFTINCKVTGGITGTRFSIVKNNDGSIKRFYTKEQAEEYAKELNEKMNNENSVATFFYWI